MDSLVFAVVGLLVGFLSSFAIFNGRISTLEADNKNQRGQLERIEASLGRVEKQVRMLAIELARQGGAHTPLPLELEG